MNRYDAVVWLLVGMPIAWFASEYQSNRRIRIGLGIASISLCFVVAWVAGDMNLWNYNAWYGAASKDLIVHTLRELRNGNTDAVILQLEILNNELDPNYENRAHYDKKVDDYVSAISDGPIRTQR